MKLKFTKMHGCGNDYIYFNCFETGIISPETLAVSLCDRHRSVGGDGIVLILPSDIADGRMRMFNQDGSEAQMCGNAIRCVAKYLRDKGMVSGRYMSIETLSGVKEVEVFPRHGSVFSAKVNMGPAELNPRRIPVLLSGETIVSRRVEIGGSEYNITCVSMGNPHAVVFSENIDRLNLNDIGPLFENAEIFPERINTEFAEVAGDNSLRMRVWERGSGETQACGTGACACAVAAVLNGYCDKAADISVGLLGGELIINYTDEAVYMTGDCHTAFEGELEIIIPAATKTYLCFAAGSPS